MTTITRRHDGILMLHLVVIMAGFVVYVKSNEETMLCSFCISEQCRRMESRKCLTSCYVTLRQDIGKLVNKGCSNYESPLLRYIQVYQYQCSEYEDNIVQCLCYSDRCNEDHRALAHYYGTHGHNANKTTKIPKYDKGMFTTRMASSMKTEGVTHRAATHGTVATAAATQETGNLFTNSSLSGNETFTTRGRDFTTNGKDFTTRVRNFTGIGATLNPRAESLKNGTNGTSTGHNNGCKSFSGIDLELMLLVWSALLFICGSSEISFI